MSEHIAGFADDFDFLLEIDIALIHLRLHDRQSLEQLAGAYYGVAESEYERLLKTPWPN